jgi:hypothetical protein
MLTIEKFIHNLEITQTGCWIYKKGGTTSLMYRGKMTSVIRVIFEYYGKEYKGKVIRECKNKQCWNPYHMLSLSPEERFWSNVNIKDDAECWEWRGVAGTDKYGMTHWREKDWATHRIAWTLTNGEIPSGLLVCHHCDNPPCVNPKHLFLGTDMDNMQDMIKKGRVTDNLMYSVVWA